MKSEFTLRPANAGDQDFVFGTYRVSMREYVEWAWGWDEDFQRSGFWQNHPIEQIQIVQINGRSAGVLHVEEQDACNFLKMVFLIPECRRQGIGSRLVTAEISRARDRGRQLLLKVIKVNPAKGLYERLGFAVLEEDHVTYLMSAA